MSLRDHLQEIYDENSKLTPQLVVDAARDPFHPLHDRFEWNDAVAGEKHRQAQATQLIRRVKITFREATATSPAKRTRAWVAPRQAEKPNEYVPVHEILEDPLSRQILLRQMERDWKDLKRRYKEFEEFHRMVRAEIESDDAGAA